MNLNYTITLTVKGIPLDKVLNRRRDVNPDVLVKIKELLPKYHGFTFDEINVRSRQRELAEARFHCFYLLRCQKGSTLKGIGKMFGRDHSSVINGIQVWQDLIDTYPAKRRIHEAFLNELKN